MSLTKLTLFVAVAIVIVSVVIGAGLSYVSDQLSLSSVPTSIQTTPAQAVNTITGTGGIVITSHILHAGYSAINQDGEEDPGRTILNGVIALGLLLLVIICLGVAVVSIANP